MSVLIELSIFPMDKGTSLSPYVARAVKIIKESGLDYVFGPMSTTIEGEYDEVMAVVKRCHDDLRRDSDRALMYLRMDSKKSEPGRITAKIKSVEEKL